MSGVLTDLVRRGRQAHRISAVFWSMLVALASASCGAPSQRVKRFIARCCAATSRRRGESFQRDPSSVRATDEAGMTVLHFAVARLRVVPELAADAQRRKSTRAARRARADVPPPRP
jgi:hypothetical protein